MLLLKPPFKRFVGRALALWVVLSAGGVRSAGTVDDALLKVLRERSVPFDREAMSASALEAAVAAVDPGGCVLAAGEVPPGDGRRSVLKAETWVQGLRYLKLSGLHDDAAKSVSETLCSWATNDFAGLVVDLRSAGGNNLEAVERIAAHFVGRNVVLYALRNGRGEVVETCRAADTDAVLRLTAPVMVLIDGGTGGASETLAAVLKGNRGVLLLGQRSSGDSGIREVIPFSASNSLYVATRWVTPLSGGLWRTENFGEPDVVIAASDDGSEMPEEPRRTGLARPLSERARLDEELMRRVRGDSVLARAADILLGLRALGGVPSAAVDAPRDCRSSGEEKEPGVSGMPADTSSTTAVPAPCRQE